MEFNEIKDEINKAIEGCNDPHITFLKPFLLMLFTLFENQNHLIESLNQKIETLQFALQQKSLKNPRKIKLFRLILFFLGCII